MKLDESYKNVALLSYSTYKLKMKIRTEPTIMYPIVF